MCFKICVIGCGSMSETGHGPACSKYAHIHQDVELAACCDIDAEKAMRYQSQFGFKRFYTDYVLMLEKEKPDAVCLIVPVTITKKLAVSILEKGYPVIMEKPPGLNREETLEIIKAAETNHVFARVAFNRRYIPLIRDLKREMAENFIPEKIQNISYSLYRVGRRDEDFATTAIHAIDVVKFLAESDYKYIHFDYQEFPELGKNVANIFMHCEFYSGSTAQLSFVPVGGVVVERCVVNARNHTLFLNIPVWGAMDSPGKLTHVVSNKITYEVTGQEISDGEDFSAINGFYGENASFLDALRRGDNLKHDIDTGIQSVEIADCIRSRKREYRNNGG